MQLTSAQQAFLSEVHFAIVATIGPEGMPHQTVIWYMLDGDRVMRNTPTGSAKHRHLRRDPRLSVCVEDAYQYVTLQGRVSLNEDAEQARADYERLSQRYRGTFPARPAPAHSTAGSRAPARPRAVSRDRVTLWLDVERVIENRFGA